VSWHRRPHASPLWNPEISNTNSLLKWFTWLLHDFIPVVRQRSSTIPHSRVRPDELIEIEAKVYSVKRRVTNQKAAIIKAYSCPIFCFCLAVWFDSLSEKSNILRRNISYYDSAKYSFLCSSFVKEPNIYFRFPPGRELSTFFPAYADLEILYLGTIPDGSCVTLKATATCVQGGETLYHHWFFSVPASSVCVCVCVCVCVKSNCVNVTGIETMSISIVPVLCRQTLGISNNQLPEIWAYSTEATERGTMAFQASPLLPTVIFFELLLTCHPA